MNILLVSECSKQALPETRRILDQFAERKGRRTWQTPITFEGLKTLRKLLKKTARRNTAVACHWVRGKNHTELMWIVGNRRKFNVDGTVPTNSTQRDILRSQDENPMNSIQTAAIMAGVAGLFHDFGKANVLFQQKLQKGHGFEPYRHEWLSCLMFLKFVAGRKDSEWLSHLANIKPCDEQAILNDLNPEAALGFSQLQHAPLAQCIAWLIVSHHRMLKSLAYPQSLDSVDTWLSSGIDVNWNALNHDYTGFGDKEKRQAVSFPQGTPFASYKWRSKAKSLAQRAMNLPSLNEYAQLEQVFPLHIARMALMLSDHAYSAGPANTQWQDDTYKVFANTDKKAKTLKQQLDEHCIGVAHNAYILARTLPKLRTVLPAITQHKGFKRRSKISKFCWQDKAYDLAYSIADQTEHQGFFGVNMASTGKGKTFANARIMYGLSNPQQGCRFNVALGLRNLTLQTGDALQSRLSLDSDDIAVHIGSQAVKELFSYQGKNKSQNQAQIEKSLTQDANTSRTGSESEFAFSEHNYVRYDGEVDNHYLNRWLEDRGAAHSLVSAPIAVSTIDYLIPASEGISGGQQIAPMLRLLTSDLVLDEPDDFSLEDDPALARLVYFAGLLGSRVLLSSATLPPSLVTHLFACYQSGRQQYNQVTGQQTQLPVKCGWFDEFEVRQADVESAKAFVLHHSGMGEESNNSFVSKRQQSLAKKAAPLHRGDWLHVDSTNIASSDIIGDVANVIRQGIEQLSSQHTTTSEQTSSQGKTVSAGIVRMANIEPLVAVAQQLLAIPAPENTRFHYCVYHSQHPLGVRSAIESNLDALLQRDSHDLQGIVKHPDVESLFAMYPEQHHVLVVLATPVAEVGRDHDYDWAIVEPSSMRSIIQLAGRVQRHRQIEPSNPNILVMTQNIRALKQKMLAYVKPGFESAKAYKNKKGEMRKCLQLADHDLSKILDFNHIDEITSVPRFTQVISKGNQGKDNRFIQLEHLAMQLHLKQTVQPWWQSAHAHLFGEFQKQTPFRQGHPTTDYVFMLEEAGGVPLLTQWDQSQDKWVDSGLLVHCEDLEMAEGNAVWGRVALAEVVEQQDNSLEQACQKFATISLPAQSPNQFGNKWQYHPVLGVFRGREM